MPETELAVIVETSVKESANRLLLQYMRRYFTAESEIGIFETSGIPMFDKPKSKVALAAIKELSDKIEAADGASLQCQICAPVALLNVFLWLAYTSRAFKFTFF
ncbi:NADPH-dependent FMN reductase [Ligilactobacillus ruminis]|uniref:Uncharacterized protein n=1 Tax=Ligilactobacillus ruminis ATCC 25644 TaxID=525362 RepID=E7FND7_9LACO|nr:hypothetical protein [Ligilactobacillus ruminis]EFZ35394.1 hypothetical protein HMPREF0542_10414 [Ligilactobacillus ruminis ATCC 25644]EGX98146.1 oxidoreductase (putative) [Ligilactobacillus ruminis ATCC 25644]UWP40957.1 NADPH-dependent FMN reductase [Ligilactobacillus ruminis]